MKRTLCNALIVGCWWSFFTGDIGPFTNLPAIELLLLQVYWLLAAHFLLERTREYATLAPLVHA